MVKQIGEEHILRAQRIAIFAPHPDDAELACGGIICKRLKSGRKTFIVQLTDGRNSHLITYGIRKKPSPFELQEIRKLEVISAERILGNAIENLYFCDIEDGMPCFKNIATKKVIDFIQIIKPNLILLPYRYETHPDHKATYEIVKQAIENSGADAMIYQYFVGMRTIRYAQVL